MTNDKMSSLSESFIEDLKKRPKTFGFNGLGETVFLRTYAREITDGKLSRKEEWYETVKRVMNGILKIQSERSERSECSERSEHSECSERSEHSECSERSEQLPAPMVGFDHKAIELMTTQMYDMKWLPPGRGLWAMGSPVINEKHLFAALNNCAFVSTQEATSRPFTFLMDMLMLGVGVGSDTRGASKITIVKPAEPTEFKIPDDREGWVESVRVLLDSYFLGSSKPIFDYSGLRPLGAKLKNFGGISSGPGPLKDLHETLDAILGKNVGKLMDSRLIADIVNLIGKCVVSGNIRRSAEIMLGKHTDDEFLRLKDYESNPERMAWGSMSNNSILADVGMDYSKIVDLISTNGEPGILWLDNARTYGRMMDPPNHADYKALGVNPCGEQTLESYELCCLVEVFPDRCVDYEEFVSVLSAAFTYAKTVTLGSIHWPESDKILKRNRRIGISLSGLAEFIEKRGLGELESWLEGGYAHIEEMDETWSALYGIPRSIKLTTIKPSGTISLLPGATAGMHYHHSRYYIRRVAIGNDDPVLECLRKARYRIEDYKYTKNTSVVEFPIDAGPTARAADDLSMWEQLCLASLLQAYWSDNQVSVTVNFKKSEKKDIVRALRYFETKLKGVSFYPDPSEGKIYEQSPLQKIDATEYNKMMTELLPLDFQSIYHPGHVIDLHDAIGELYCDGDKCVSP